MSFFGGQDFVSNCKGGIRNTSTPDIGTTAQIIVFTENGTNWDPNNPEVIEDENDNPIFVTEDTNQLVAGILNSELYKIFNRDVEQPHNNVHVRCGCIMTTGMLALKLLTE